MQVHTKSCYYVWESYLLTKPFICYSLIIIQNIYFPISRCFTILNSLKCLDSLPNYHEGTDLRSSLCLPQVNSHPLKGSIQ